MADRFKGNSVESYIHACDHVTVWSKGRGVQEITQKRAIAVLTKALMREGEKMRPPDLDSLCNEQLKYYVEELLGWYEEQMLPRGQR